MPVNSGAPMDRNGNLGLFIDRELGRPFVTNGRFNSKAQGAESKAHVTLGRELAGRGERIAPLIERRLRRLEALRTARGGLGVELTATSRMTTGTGRRSPIDVGFHLDWTSGWPVLPASGIKGMVRQWAAHWAEGTRMEAAFPGLEIREHVGLIFGEEPLGDESGWAGGVLFCDGIVHARTARGRMPIRFDVMTPHYTDELADWAEPNPITYLVLEEGTRVTTALIPREPDMAPLLEVAAAWLEAAFLDIGAGAKTKEGKGRFAVDQT